VSDPLRIGKKISSNRLVSTAHGENFAADGLLTEHLISYHVRRARGGAGILFTFGSGTVWPEADNPKHVSLWDPRNEGALRDMAARVHEYPTLLIAQAVHRGVRESPTSLNATTQAPSARPPLNLYGSPRVLEHSEIAAIVGAFGDAAERLERCGFDGIELTALGSHLMEQFWSPALNRRQDEYGGSFQNRMRFAVEVVERVRASVSDDFIVGFRLSGDPQSDLLGLTPQDMVSIAAHLDGLKCLDLFSVSGGSGVNIETHAGNVPTDTFEESCYADLSREIRNKVNVPVVVAGRVLNSSQAQTVLDLGQADLIGMTRAMIADADVVRNTLAGADERTRPCIAINEGCRRVIAGNSLACTVNPAVAHPSLMDLPPALVRKKVLVVGAGPAGLEAARVAAERGHSVTVWERSGRAGGQLVTAALDPNRPNLGRHVEWSVRELNRLGVGIQYNKEAIVHGREYEEFHEVVLATGSRSVLPWHLTNRPNYATDTEVWSNPARVPVGGDVVVVDAESYGRGGRIANHLSESGAKTVTLAVPTLSPMEFLEASNKPFLLRAFARNGVEVLTSWELNERAGDTAVIRHRWSDDVRAVDSAHLVVFVGYNESYDPLAELHSRKDSVPFHVIGDAKAPRLLRNAISEGALLAASL
jgi:2,4-dienoyl-CoA reductase-like NADH-dependent reductase (Old Yellow Enzyme family)/thioredoxin reductase